MVRLFYFKDCLTVSLISIQFNCVMIINIYIHLHVVPQKQNIYRLYVDSMNHWICNSSTCKKNSTESILICENPPTTEKNNYQCSIGDSFSAIRRRVNLYSFEYVLYCSVVWMHLLHCHKLTDHLQQILIGKKIKVKRPFVRKAIVSLWAVICMPDNLRAGCHTPYPNTACCILMLPVCWHVLPVPQPQIWNPGRNLTRAVYWLRLHPRCCPHPRRCGTSLG